jgi:hypothetical protein
MATTNVRDGLGGFTEWMCVIDNRCDHPRFDQSRQRVEAPPVVALTAR